MNDTKMRVIGYTDEGRTVYTDFSQQAYTKDSVSGHFLQYHGSYTALGEQS